MAKRGRPKKTVEKMPKPVGDIVVDRYGREHFVKERKKKPTALAAVVESAPLAKKEELSESAINKAFDLLGIGAKLDPQARALFVAIAKLHHLNPLKREIHAVTMGGKLVPVVGYEVYIQRARDTGLLQYWRIEEEGDGPTYKAVLVIKRRDWPQEFRWTARYSEVKRDGPMWRERPTFMTQKVAISQGFRLCFGDELGGMPYTVEEMTNGISEEPKLVRPEEKKDAIETTALPVELVSEEEEARKALSMLYKEMKASAKYNQQELEERKEQAIAAKGNLNSLVDLRSAWQQEMQERRGA